jgi:DNA-directed RNA polymerase specialized sigma24 family protein
LLAADGAGQAGGPGPSGIARQSGPARSRPTEDDAPSALEALYQQIEALPEKEREVVDLLYFHGLSQPETAAILGVTERSVRRYWTAARLKLLQAMPNSMPAVPGSFVEG